MAIELGTDLPEYIPYHDEEGMQKAVQLVSWTDAMPKWFGNHDRIMIDRADYLYRFLPDCTQFFDDFDDLTFCVVEGQLVVVHVLHGVETTVPFKYEPLAS